MKPAQRDALIEALERLAVDLESSQERGLKIADEAGITDPTLRSACELGALRCVVEHTPRDLRSIVDAYIRPKRRR